MDSESALPWLLWAVSLVCFFLSSVAAASIDSVRIERVQGLVAEGTPGSRRLEGLFSNPAGPSRALSLLKGLFTVSGLVSAGTLAMSVWDLNWLSISLVLLAAAAILLVAHAASAALSALYGERIALMAAPLAWRLDRLVRAVTAIEDSVVRRMARGNAGPENGSDTAAADLGVGTNGDAAPIDEREAQMIRGVVRLDQTTAREIMLPRIDMVGAELGTPLVDLAETMVDSGHSRIPVYEDSLDEIKGIAHSRDILGMFSRRDDKSGTLTQEVIRPALFIPESKNLEELLSEFQERQVQMAIVVDEYGGVSGLVTIEDLLEEIVGEITDEFDVGGPEIEAVGKDQFFVDARISVDQLSQLVGVELEGGGFDTVGGFVYHRLGKIPSSGDSVEFDGLTIEVVSTVGRRLKRLRVTRTA